MSDTWDIPPQTPEQIIEELRIECIRLRDKVKELRGYHDDAMRYRRLRPLIEYAVNSVGEQTIYAGYNLGPASLLPATLEEVLDEGINLR